MKNIIITLLVLFSSLTSCKEKEKENINKKYHWVAYVKPVSGYPIRAYRGVVYGKDGASKFGNGQSFLFDNKGPFPHFSIERGAMGVFGSSEEKEGILDF